MSKKIFLKIFTISAFLGLIIIYFTLGGKIGYRKVNENSIYNVLAGGLLILPLILFFIFDQKNKS
ncbi:hypothetical protein [Flavobacterium cheniae]|uniref:Uncharacterized protein n=1 Tax=Flavobacterium cheniae TaxID=295428 RepID=A0A562KSH1_9FLAO|nr:hypothetical protein [Flavobacterium cheniae]TDR25490.1 hypothetical protein C8D80_0263 [Flavobacterium cheniae]TWH98324.1 hypothetical protein IP97_00273 [Flavobacterium cheniae]